MRRKDLISRHVSVAFWLLKWRCLFQPKNSDWYTWVISPLFGIISLIALFFIFCFGFTHHSSPSDFNIFLILAIQVSKPRTYYIMNVFGILLLVLIHSSNIVSGLKRLRLAEASRCIVRSFINQLWKRILIIYTFIYKRQL